MRLRTGLAATLVACVPCVPSLAAPPKPVPAKPPQIVDPAGDQTAMNASYDIRSATFSTTGTTVRTGKKTTYVPTRLVVAVAYSAPIGSDPLAAQVVSFATADCRVYLERYGDNRTYGSASCVTGAFTVPFAVSGSTLTFSLPLAAVGKSLHAGVELVHLSTWTNVAEPTRGYEAGDLVGPAFTVDVANGTTTYVIH